VLSTRHVFGQICAAQPLPRAQELPQMPSISMSLQPINAGKLARRYSLLNVPGWPRGRSHIIRCRMWLSINWSSYGLAKNRVFSGNSPGPHVTRADVTIKCIQGQIRRVCRANIKPSIEPGILTSVKSTWSRLASLWRIC